MHAYDYLGNVALLDGVDEAGGDVEVEALDRVDAEIHGRGGLLGLFETRASDGAVAGSVIGDDVEGVEARVARVVVHEHGEVDQRRGRHGVADRYEHVGWASAHAFGG